MELLNKTVGYAICGSFCTFKQTFDAMDSLRSAGSKIIPIMSETAFSTDTRFGKAKDIQSIVRNKSDADIIHTMRAAEPIGPKMILDALIIAPCTGNTLAKLANAIADSSVTLAAKAHLRNERPIIIGVSTNDALGAAAQNIGRLLSRKHIYFVPFAQDDYINKPNSLVCNFNLINQTLEAALDNRQIQPILAV